MRRIASVHAPTQLFRFAVGLGFVSFAAALLLQKGDVVFFNNILFHRGKCRLTIHVAVYPALVNTVLRTPAWCTLGGENKSQHIRWSMDWRYQDARCRTFRPEAGECSTALRTRRVLHVCRLTLRRCIIKPHVVPAFYF